MSDVLRLGTRGSLLARTQSGWVARELEKRRPGLRVELTIIETTGDQIADKPLRDAGGKGLFVKELELALLAGQIDFAVHSMKDVPVTEPLVEQSDLLIAAVPAREDPRDALVCPGVRRLADLPAGAKIGTGSLRRRCQILALRPDLRVQGVRGNIDTRLRKQREGQFDAVILAMAGLKRTGLFDAGLMSPIDPDELLPSAGQGALAIQCRRSDARTSELLSVLHDPGTAACVQAERELVLRLQGDCHSPIAALATLSAGQLHLSAAVGTRDGSPPVIRASGAGSSAVEDVFERLREQNVEAMLR